MQFLYWIEMPPSNRLDIKDNEENERSPGAFNITCEAQRRMVLVQYLNLRKTAP
jgi:hypothetical protein